MSSRSTIDGERNDALGAWFAEHGRDLPWRRSRDPYRTLVSEAMLQQTQASRVIPFFENFIATFPTVEDLAAASLADVLRLWNGLGYNRRAQRLHAAAQVIAATGWPSDLTGLRALPGVGPYTAAAIASMAFGLRVAAVDTNVRRVLSRWNGEPLTGTLLDEAADAALGADAGAWNEAIMDLGAALCRPKAPRCDMCPVAQWCAGPDTYEPPPRQSPFAGSVRAVRGAIIRRLAQSPATTTQLAVAVETNGSTLTTALYDLVAEGLVEFDDTRWRLPE